MDDFLNDDKFDIIIFYVFNAGIIIFSFKFLFVKNNLFFKKNYFNFLTIFFVVYIFWEIYTFFFPNKNCQVKKKLNCVSF